MVADQGLGKKKRPLFGVAFGSIAVLAIAYGLHVRANAIDSALNYKLVYALPKGWSNRPVVPGMVFVYENDSNHLSMRGSISNVISETNPTPNLDAEALIKEYQYITTQNLHGWQYALLEPVEARGAQFRLIRRWTDDRCVVSAVAVRGNTTIIIALVANKTTVPKLDEGLPEFRSYLANLALTPVVYQ